MKEKAIIAVALAALSLPAAAQEPDRQPQNILLWPMPETVSAEGRAAAEAAAKVSLGEPLPPLAQIRQLVDGMQAAMGAELQKQYGVSVEERVIAGVPVRVVLPAGISEAGSGPILMNLHGGGGKLDSGSLSETIPIAGLTGLPVVSVLYRLAPEHPYPARLEDALAVYGALASERPAAQIGVFGTSAGAVLSGQLLARLAKSGSPLPGALGFFAGTADLARKGDSEGWMPTPTGVLAPETDYGVPLDDPILSPTYGDLARFPPTLLITSTRDIALSGTANFGRALLQSGVNARLIVFDGLPHAFWAYMPAIPETTQANKLIADFLKKQVVQ